MAEKRKSAAAPILAVLAIVSALLGAYVAGYVFMGISMLLFIVVGYRGGG